MTSILTTVFSIAEWNNLISGLAGAIIGGGASIWAALITNQKEENLKKREQIQEKIRKFTAVKCEIEYLLERYIAVYGSIISNTRENQPVEEMSVSKGDYFVIYKNNSECVGDIKSSKTQENIIKAYIMSNAIFEELEINNSIFSDIQEKEKILKFDKYSSHYVDTVKLNLEISILKEQLSGYGNILRQDNKSLIEYSKNAIDGLNKEINFLNKEYEENRFLRLFRFS